MDSLETFVLLTSERNNFFTPVPHDWDLESVRALGVQTLVIFSYLADHLLLSGLRVCEHFGRTVEEGIELMPLAAISGIVRQGVVNRFATYLALCVCGNDGVFIHYSQAMVLQAFASRNFVFLRRMRFSLILALPVIAQMGKVAGILPSWNGFCWSTSGQISSV